MDPSSLITIVVTLKNRFEHFKRCVKSLSESDHGAVELVVIDFGSDDGDVAGEIEYLDFPARVISIEGPFNQNVGRNRGAKEARGDIVFNLDADMMVPKEGCFDLVRQHVGPGLAYFPISWRREDEDGKLITDIHIELGYGLSALTPQDIATVGGWDEGFIAWGYDDIEFADRLRRDTSIEIARGRIPGLIHQYHPNTWEHRNKYTEVPDATSYRHRSGKVAW